MYDKSWADKSNYKIDKWLNIVNELGVGEVMITSIDSDGLCDGYDKELVKEIQKYKFNFPIVYGGGINSTENVDELLSNIIFLAQILLQLFIKQFGYKKFEELFVYKKP